MRYGTMYDGGLNVGRMVRKQGYIGTWTREKIYEERLKRHSR